MKGQTSLELALSIVCILLLLLGSMRLFVWVNKCLVLRQERYELTRDNATEASFESQYQVDESQIPKLRIFD